MVHNGTQLCTIKGLYRFVHFTVCNFIPEKEGEDGRGGEGERGKGKMVTASKN